MGELLGVLSIQDEIDTADLEGFVFLFPPGSIEELRICLVVIDEDVAPLVALGSLVIEESFASEGMS